MNTTDYREFPERKAEFLCRAARIREAKRPAELVDFTDEIAAIDGLLAKLGKPAEPATVGEAECALFGNVYQPEGSELHLLEWEREVRETRESDRP
jgi:hypothetical protein